jgi:acyl carrier protein
MKKSEILINLTVFINMNQIFNKIREILHYSYSINYDQIELETNFELELGMDSREFFEIIVDFEKVFNINIFLDDLSEIVTIQDAVNYIEKKIETQDKTNNNL